MSVYTQNSVDSNLLSPESTTSQQDSQNQEDSAVSAMLVREVLYGNRDNVNFVHELYRQAFLLDFNHAGAIRKAIAVYKDWIQMNVSFKYSENYVLYVQTHLCKLLYVYFLGNPAVYVGTTRWP